MVLIAVGANLPLGEGSALSTCKAVVKNLQATPNLEVLAVSHWYESAPVPPSGQPPYVNGVIKVRTSLSPDALLALLQRMEAEFGRERSVPNAARTLDLDLIAYDDLCQDDPHLTLPHPRAHERAFVLLPLHDVAPDWVHPVSQRPVAELLAAVSGQEISRIK
ncbi:MAG: 2-amino-4-hydroxy-6-hydroxymethyldihydropteridine diphosphokinase [Acetobacter cibinongensis]